MTDLTALADERDALAADLEKVQTQLDEAELRIKELESRLAAQTPSSAVADTRPDCADLSYLEKPFPVLSASTDYAAGMRDGLRKYAFKKIRRQKGGILSAWEHVAWGCKECEGEWPIYTPEQHKEGCLCAFPVPDGREEIQSKEGHCPTCDSPHPARHPAVQFEGEVQICKDNFHSSGPSEANATGDEAKGLEGLASGIEKSLGASGQEPVRWECLGLNNKWAICVKPNDGELANCPDKYRALYAAPVPTADRETIARIIDPVAFKVNDGKDIYAKGTMQFACDAAREKADAILSRTDAGGG